QPGHSPTRRNRRARCMQGDPVFNRAALKRGPAAHHLVENAAERVYVGSWAEHAGDTAPLLGRHVRRGSKSDPRVSERGQRMASGRLMRGELGEPEVENLEPVAMYNQRIVEQEQVLWLEITVQDAALVYDGERKRDLKTDGPGLAGRE